MRDNTELSFGGNYFLRDTNKHFRILRSNLERFRKNEMDYFEKFEYCMIYFNVYDLSAFNVDIDFSDDIMNTLEDIIYNNEDDIIDVIDDLSAFTRDKFYTYCVLIINKLVRNFKSADNDFDMYHATDNTEHNYDILESLTVMLAKVGCDLDE